LWFIEREANYPVEFFVHRIQPASVYQKTCKVIEIESRDREDALRYLVYTSFERLITDKTEDLHRAKLAIQNLISEYEKSTN
jgi:hypothetical protein